MPETEDKLTTIIPDFYYDLIGRIAPGFVAITVSVYWSGSNFEVVFSTIGQSVFALVIAWLIGVTLDVGVYYIGTSFRLDEFLKCLKSNGLKISCLKNWKRALLKRSQVSKAGENHVYNYLSKASPWERGSLIKQQALLILYRNMLSICALTALICFFMRFFPEWLSSSLNSLLPVLHCHYWRYFVLTVVFSLIFAVCWWHQSISLDAWDEFIKKNEQQDRR
jgi:hypothetical protein